MMLQNMSFLNLLTAFNTREVVKSSMNIWGLSVCYGKHYMKLRQLVKEWQSKIFEVLGSAWIFCETRAKKIREKTFGGTELEDGVK